MTHGKIKSKHMKKTQLIFLFLIASVGVFAQETEDPFEQFRQQANQGFDAFREETNKQWEAYEKANKEAFDAFKKGIEQKWGEGNFVESTQTTWVEYDENADSRSEVDFENGEATVEVLMEPEEAANAVLVKEKIAEAVKELALNKGKSKDYSTEYEKPEPLSEEPVLKDQLTNGQGETVTPENVTKYAEEVAETKPVEKKTVQTEDEKPKVVVSVKIPLATNNIQTRALKFYGNIMQNTGRFGVDPQLVFAVIHTESAYNPKARSHVPAFGLMQIVPKYAGRDAYNYVYKQDKLLSENYLYEAVNNIELGTAYLHMLIDRSFAKVTNPVSRVYCAICAYNTGAGNVSRAFIGTTKLYQAIPEINKMSPEEVYKHLKANLPYDETKDYLDRVSSRMKVYEDWLSND